MNGAKKRTVCILLAALSMLFLPAATAFADGEETGGSHELCVIAHQGYSAVAPGNTLAAFRLAGMHGFWGAECDVRQTADGIWVVFHNTLIDKPTDGKGNVNRMTYAELQQYRVDAGNGLEQYPNEKIPTLEEYLDVCKAYGMHPVIDVQHNVNKSCAPSLAALLGEREEKDSVTVISFNNEFLVAVKNCLPCLHTYVVRKKISDADIAYCLHHGINGISFSTATQQSMISKAHASGLQTMVWTVEDVAEAEFYLSLGVSAVTSNSVAPLPEPTKKSLEQETESTASGESSSPPVNQHPTEPQPQEKIQSGFWHWLTELLAKIKETLGGNSK